MEIKQADRCTGSFCGTTVASTQEGGDGLMVNAVEQREGAFPGQRGACPGRKEVCLGRAGADLTPSSRGRAFEPGAGATLVQAEGLPCWWPLDHAMTGR